MNTLQDLIGQKQDLEQSITAAVNKALNDFKNQYGYTPSDIEIKMAPIGEQDGCELYMCSGASVTFNQL